MLSEVQLIDLAHTVAQIKGLEPSKVSLFEIYYELRRNHRVWTWLVGQTTQNHLETAGPSTARRRGQSGLVAV